MHPDSQLPLTLLQPVHVSKHFVAHSRPKNPYGQADIKKREKYH